LDLSIRQVAKLLKVSEDTVYRWARQGLLPAHRVDEQFRFNRVELQEWATSHKQKVSPDLFAAEGETRKPPSLLEAIERGGIFTQVPGEEREQVLEAITLLPAIPAGVNRPMLLALLIAREAMASTGLGEGIAIPHPRDPLVVAVDEPRVLLCFLERSVDFHALDGQPVRVLFLLLSPSVRQHLQMLAQLAYALHDAPLKELLRTAAPPAEILSRLRALEQR
jgi:PTS system nitrogen regulatory IIA component